MARFRFPNLLHNSVNYSEGARRSGEACLAVAVAFHFCRIALETRDLWRPPGSPSPSPRLTAMQDSLDDLSGSATHSGWPEQPFGYNADIGLRQEPARSRRIRQRMKTIVTDEAVNKWADCLRAGLPTSNVFPVKMSDCDFTDAQRELIRKARAEKKAEIKTLKKASQPQAIIKKLKSSDAAPTESKSKPLTKLRKMLYLQSGKCFFCGEALTEAEASIEHLQPLSHGGRRAEDNEVVCHKSLNETFGQMDLKRKIEFVLRSSSNFRCPQV